LNFNRFSKRKKQKNKMIKMVKLKIGTIGKKKETTPTILDSYADGYSDEELEAMSIEANEIPEKILKEVEEIPEDIKKEAEEEAEIKGAVNDVFILDEVGIHMKYVEKYTELFPNKKIIYHDFITKTFLEWYIKKAKLLLLKKLYIKDSEFVSPKQQEELVKLVAKRLYDETNDFVEKEITKQLKDEGLIEISDAELDGTVIELETKKQIEAYEFILTEKWNENDRAKGIRELGAILEEQMRVQKINLETALMCVIDGFNLQNKWIKTLEEPKEVEKKKKPSNAEVSKELDKSIKYFHHIKFLYELMGSDKFTLNRVLSDKEIEHIEKIDELLYSTTKTTQEKKKKTTESMDNFFGEGK